MKHTFTSRREQDAQGCCVCYERTVTKAEEEDRRKGTAMTARKKRKEKKKSKETLKKPTTYKKTFVDKL